MEQIKRAYREAVLRCHPDVYAGSTEDGARRFQQVHDAYKAALRAALTAARTARMAARGAPSRAVGFAGLSARGARRLYTPPPWPEGRDRKGEPQARPRSRRRAKAKRLWREARNAAIPVLLVLAVLA